MLLEDLKEADTRVICVIEVELDRHRLRGRDGETEKTTLGQEICPK